MTDYDDKYLKLEQIHLEDRSMIGSLKAILKKLVDMVDSETPIKGTLSHTVAKRMVYGEDYLERNR